MSLKTAKEKAIAGERLSLEDALALYYDNDLLFLGTAARAKKERQSGRKVFYNINRHINLTNVCTSNCPLCAFGCREGEKQAFVLEISDVEKILAQAKKTPHLSEIHIVSALSPDKPYDYYLQVVKTVKEHLPQVAIKAFTPVEIVHFAKITGRSIVSILKELAAFGLSSLPGGGAEILSDRVRSIICPRKATAREWLEVMRAAGELGIDAGASIMYGHIETIEERFAHLITIRDWQDKTHAFSSFAAFPFHPKNTSLSFITGPGSWENLKMMALFRLVLDNIPHFKAFWIMLTLEVAQLALLFGADDLDGTIGEEKIIHAAQAPGKTATSITTDKIRRIIAEVGYEPTLRDTFYNEVTL